MKIRYYTVSFLGKGAITCPKCKRKIILNACNAIVHDEEFRHRILSADDATVLHLCGRKLSYFCDGCGGPAIDLLDRLPKKEPICINCGERLRQVEISPDRG